MGKLRATITTCKVGFLGLLRGHEALRYDSADLKLAETGVSFDVHPKSCALYSVPAILFLQVESRVPIKGIFSAFICKAA
jgi:hypothetical protein